ncbi:MAG TPA: undecaprenyl-phosphate glucose phosphotransferase [Casimicrobiaceae bacterium]|nr:undecaprenyl-phosphate glucose phosphotransferase [Casimicrobiaceae bacterium]
MFSTLLKVVDPLVIVLTGIASYYARFGDIDLPPDYVTVLLTALVLSLVVLNAFDVYRWRPDEGVLRGIRRLFGGWIGVVLVVVMLLFATQTGRIFSRQWLGVWSVAALAGMFLVRVASVHLLKSLHRRGVAIRRVVIVGAGRLGKEIAERFTRSPQVGFRVAGFFDDDPALAGGSFSGVPVRGTVADLRDYLERETVDQVWVALPLRAEDRVRELLDDLVPRNIKIRFVPDIFGFQLLNHSFTEVCGFPVINVTESPLSGLKGALKWLEDKLVALVVLALIWPVLLAIAIGVKLTSPGPVIFRQRRGGLDNREIVVWKFRSMAVHDEKVTGDVPQARRNDPRVTPFGAFLRRTSLDELPQFINVLFGDMSVVGPRPHPLWLNDFHRDKIPRYVLRSWIKPGITGWAQVCGWRGETDELWKMEMRVQHDLYYIENWSLGFDLYIILMTIFRLRSPQAY